jgi:hypothetical protein
MRVAAAYLADALGPVAANEDGAAQARTTGPTVSVARAHLERLAGIYKGETPNQLMSIWLVGDTLRATSRTGPILRPLGDGRFDVVGQNVVATLRPDSAGEPGFLDAPGLGRLTRVGAHWNADRDSLEPYAGNYYSEELGTEYRIETTNGALVVRHRKLPEGRLEPAARDLFLQGSRVFAFQRDASGQVSGFTVSDGRVWNVGFERR